VQRWQEDGGVGASSEEPVVFGEDGSWTPRTLVFPISMVILRSDGDSVSGEDMPSPPPSGFADEDNDHEQHGW
jgi:hypothetical protein